MISRLSNAVSDTFFGLPSAFLQCYEVWSFFRIFRGKMHILECALKLNKIMNVSSFVSFDPGNLWGWLTRRWKAQMFYSLMIKFLGATGVPHIFVIFHLWVRVKCFIQQFDWMNVIFGYHAYQYGTQNYSSRKVCYLGFPTPCPIHFSDIWMRLCVLVKFEYFSSKNSHFRMSFHTYQNH